VIKGSGAVTYQGGERGEFLIFPIDVSRSERWLASHGLPIELDNPGKVGMTNALLIAHSALKRQGSVNGLGFEPWADTVLDVDLSLEVVPPTQPGISDG
jgi:hypothetical protein